MNTNKQAETLITDFESKLSADADNLNFEEAKRLVGIFGILILGTDSHGAINWSRLSSYDFDQLNNPGDINHFFAGNPKGNVDPDNMRIVNALYLLLFGYHLWIERTGQLGTGKPFRGDTMNSANTVLGFFNYPEGDFTKRLQLALGPAASQDFWHLVTDFYYGPRSYHRIGNFLPIQNDLLAGMKTLNQARGYGGETKDFFDVFLSNVQVFATFRNSSDLASEFAAAHDAKYGFPGSPAEFADYIENYCLNSYCSGREFQIEPYPISGLDDPRNTKKTVSTFRGRQACKNGTEEEYVNLAKDYIVKATKHIDTRGEALTNRLQMILGA
ncbi:MAG: hypothetical protein Q4G30_01565 [Actinomycetaceae bacterium]|nr:hypothetical protein [Actinomycetaceae bacterium]